MADTDDARLIWELYAAALKHEPTERSGYLDHACTDPSLRARVASLLESHGLDLGQDTRLASQTPSAASQTQASLDDKSAPTSSFASSDAAAWASSISLTTYGCRVRWRSRR